MPVEKSMYYLTHLSCHLANSYKMVSIKYTNSYKMVSIKYTCFQLMCQGGEIQFDSILKSLVHFEATDDLSLQSFIIYGKNGFKKRQLGALILHVGNVHLYLLSHQLWLSNATIITALKDCFEINFEPSWTSHFPRLPRKQ